VHPAAVLPPRHAPLRQTSLVVHALPSSHGWLVSAWTQPSVVSHASSVQALPSLQSRGGPPTQAPFTIVSFVVQAFPSSHGVCARAPATASNTIAVTIPTDQAIERTARVTRNSQRAEQRSVTRRR
jgi:hypothetical protein